MARADAVIALLLVACGRPKPQPAPDLVEFLRSASASQLRLERAEWNRVVVEPYRELYDDYVREFDTSAWFITSTVMTSRPHFAGDPKLTHSQAITRWALPTLAPARVVEAGGIPVDAVFVEIGGRWRAIVRLGPIVRRRVAALHETCAYALDGVAPGNKCIEVAWAVADAALRDDRARFTHACGLAANVCGKRSP